MVSSKLYAQLGNQCFMISAAIAHALRMNTTYAFPKKTTAPGLWRTYFSHLPVMPPNRSTKCYYKERSPEFNPIPEENDITIEGYFQSEKYWHEYKKDISHILDFSSPVIKEGVSVHVRRGDYLKFPNQFPVLPVSYYFDAIEKMSSLGFKEFRIFSDDTIWCASVFNDLKRNYDIQIQPKGEPLSDMKELYLSEAFIIGNSTYSLFPALLRPDNPVVIAPAEHRWFGPKAQHLNSPDRMPERFIKI